MKILAFDTSNDTLSVAILENEKLIVKKDIFESNKQAEMLIPCIEECLNEIKIWYQDLDLISFTNGPGSFTGIRIGYSCAKALKIATKLPIIAISSLEVIAYDYYLKDVNQKEYQEILVVNDARLEEFFIQKFVIKNNNIKSSFEPMLITLDEIKDFFPKKNFLLVGSGKLLVKDLAVNVMREEKEDFIDAKNIALLAIEKYKNNNNFDSEALYIRKPRISKRKDDV